VKKGIREQFNSTILRILQKAILKCLGIGLVSVFKVGALFFISEKHFRPRRGLMQIRESKRTVPASFSLEVKRNGTFWMETPWDSDLNTLADLLHVEVKHDHNGLRVLRVGQESQLNRLRPVGNLTMYGSVEPGDYIIAIGGVLANSVADLLSLIADLRICEVTIFDQRTRLTVSWRLQLQEMLEASNYGPELLAG